MEHAFAVGQFWSRTGCIPMGGCFSTQVADLYSIWRLKKLVQVMCALDDVSTSDAGTPVWTTQIHETSVCIALAQFQDNIMVASSATRAKHLVMQSTEHCVEPTSCLCLQRCVFGCLYEQLHCGCRSQLFPPSSTGHATSD